MTERLLNMPRLGETMEEGKIVGWLVKPGEAFRRGDPILEIETDKTIAEFPALGDGEMREILAAVGETIAVGTPIARIALGAGPDWTASENEDEHEESAATDAPAPSGLVETDLVMPRLGETMEEGRIAKWLVAPGQRFVRGDAIIEIETDKTLAEFPALTDGELVTILRVEEEVVSVGVPIARILVPAALAGSTDAPARENLTPAAASVVPASAGKPAVPRGEGEKVRATPLARRLARRSGVDLTALAGSGRRGRIEKQDVLAAAGSSAPAAPSVPGDVAYAAFRQGRLAYLDGGSGTPFLLLHGFSGDRTAWSVVAAGLRKAGHRVIVPDLPGHGLTGIEVQRPEDLVGGLPELLERLGVSGVHVVAHSLGAVAALGLAAVAPGRVAALTLIAPAGIGAEIDGDFLHGMAGARSTGELAHLLRRLSPNGAELSDAGRASLLADLSRGRLVALAEAVAGPRGQRVDLLGPLGRVPANVPVRVIFGLEDRIIPWTQVTALPPRVGIHLLARSGHMPQWDQAREVLDILLARGA